MHEITGNLGFLAGGVLVTLELTVLGFVGALVLGILAAVGRVGPVPPLRMAATFYVEIFRNIPMLTLMVLFVFGLPDAGVTFSLFNSAAICLALGGGAYICESVRGGINAVPVGQAEAARAIGLTFTQCLRHVILPQALRSMISPLVNTFIGVLLTSSLAAAIGVAELTNRTQQLNIQYADAVVCFLFSGAVYVAIALGGSAVGNWLQRRLAVKR